MLVVLVVGLVVLYVYMRLWNASLYVRGAHIGVTNAFGIGSEVPTREVVCLRRTAVGSPGRTKSVGVLLVVTRDPKQLLRFYGADRLEEGGVDRVAAAIQAPLEGSW